MNFDQNPWLQSVVDATRNAGVCPSDCDDSSVDGGATTVWLVIFFVVAFFAFSALGRALVTGVVA